MIHDMLRQQPVFRLLDLEYIQCPPNWRENRHFADEHIVLLIAGGKGELWIDGQHFSISQGKSFVLIPSMLVELHADAAQPMQFYRMTFQAMRESEETESAALFLKIKSHSPFSNYGERSQTVFMEAMPVMKTLLECLQGPDQQNRHRHYLLFHQLLDILFLEESSDKQEAADAVGLAIAYMERHYQEEMTRDTLAGIAGISPWHFSRKFKETTGQSISRMLENVRIQKAREHLLRHDCSIREVAHRVGYRDESYFRSKFKENVGLSPTMFVARKREKIAALSYHYAAHLLTLNVIPFATYVEKNRESHRLQFHDAIPVHLKRAKRMDACVWEQNLQALAGAKPEVILCDELMDDEVLACMQKIAPIVSIPWLELDWRNHFREIAAFIGKKKEAELWLSGYHRKAEQLRKQWKGSRDGNSACILHIMYGSLHVYGTRNGGTVLYEDLQLAPVHDSAAIQVCKPITIEELPLYDADIILIAVDEDIPSLQYWKRLRGSRQWRSLQAVQKGEAHVIREIPWLEYSPYAHSMVLYDAAQLFV